MYMTRRRYIIIVVAIMATSIQATAGAQTGTTVSGFLSGDTTWTKAGSPYRMTGDVTIGPHAELVIEPGVRVEAVGAPCSPCSSTATGARLEVRGVLTVAGTEAEPVVFTRANDAPWGGISMSLDGVGETGEVEDVRSSIQHAVIEHADVGLDNGGADKPSIRNVAFRQNGFGLQFQVRGPWTLSDNTFVENAQALRGSTSSTITFTNNDLWNNGSGLWTMNGYSAPGTWEIHDNDLLPGPRGKDLMMWVTGAEYGTVIDASDNWWGTTDLPTIEKSIADQSGTNIPASVSWKPIATSPTTDWTPPRHSTALLPDPQDTTEPGVRALKDSPDPFTPNGDGRKDVTKISFALSEDAEVTVTILNAGGIPVRTLSTVKQLPNGFLRATWNGKNDSGRTLKSGVYSYDVVAVDGSGNTSPAHQGKVVLGPGPSADRCEPTAQTSDCLTYSASIPELLGPLSQTPRDGIASFDLAFDSIERLCWEFTFSGDLLDSGESVHVATSGKDPRLGAGFSHGGSSPAATRQLCETPSYQTTLLFYDGEERVSVVAKVGSVNIADVRITITGTASRAVSD